MQEIVGVRGERNEQTGTAGLLNAFEQRVTAVLEASVPKRPATLVLLCIDKRAATEPGSRGVSCPA